MDKARILFIGTMIGIIAFGTAMISVGVSVVVAAHGRDLRNIPVTSARLAISAGVVTMLLAFGSLFDFKVVRKRMHLVVVALGLLLVTALSLAAMSVAIDEINSIDVLKQFIATEKFYPNRDLEHLLIERRRDVAIISGFSAIAQLFALIVTIKVLQLLNRQQPVIQFTPSSKC